VTYIKYLTYIPADIYKYLTYIPADIYKYLTYILSVKATMPHRV